MPLAGVFELRWLDRHGREIGFGLFPTEDAIERRLRAAPPEATTARIGRDGVTVIAYALSADGIWEPSSQVLLRSVSQVARTPY